MHTLLKKASCSVSCIHFRFLYNESMKNGKPRVQELIPNEPKTQAERLVRIMNEFHDGYEFLKKYPKAVSIFGSERCGFEDKVYKEATKLAKLLAKDGFAIITGGGHGVMEAANRGAYEAGGKSVGLLIELPRKDVKNEYVKDSHSFYYFFSRKVMLAFASRFYIFFPGGFGTLSELFEMIMLVQTKKIRPIPIILVNKAYWKPLLKWIEGIVQEKNKAISKEDMNIYQLVDSAEEAYALIKKKTV